MIIYGVSKRGLSVFPTTLQLLKFCLSSSLRSSLWGTISPTLPLELFLPLSGIIGFYARLVVSRFLLTFSCVELLSRIRLSTSEILILLAFTSFVKGLFLDLFLDLSLFRPSLFGCDLLLFFCYRSAARFLAAKPSFSCSLSSL